MTLRIFITGASSGIGAALARHYAQPDVVLGLVARRKEALQTLAAELGATVESYSADVGDSDALRTAATDFMSRHGVPDIVIANAGISVGTAGGEEADLEVLERVMRTNVLGLAATLQPFVAPMREKRAGTLVGISSVAGFRGLPGSGAYCASKAAATTWLESLRVELVGSGVSVVTICPGFIDTPMTGKNPYAMPFMISADECASRMSRAIGLKRRCVVIPWQMGIVGFVLRRLPTWAFDRIAGDMPRKPRDAGNPPTR